MNILMIAPEPFLSPRGTPLSVYGRLHALSELGHQIDLLTYHVGEGVDIKNVRIIRAGLPGLIRNVRIGPSFAKVPLDILLFFKASALLRDNRYDCIHTHEEAALIGAALRARYRIKHVYDMHSSLPEQFINYGFPGGRMACRLTRPLERWMISRSDIVIAICPQLEKVVRARHPEARIFVIENTAPPPDDDSRLGLQPPDAGSDLVALYTGSFEANQGIDLLLQAIIQVAGKERGVRFWLVGGEPKQIARARAVVAKAEADGRVIFFGKQPHHAMPAFLRRADILLSPRATGSNVPLKTYSYLLSGKAIAATNLPVHTQVLNDQIAVLTDSSPASFADGIISLVKDKELRVRLGRNARRIGESKFTWESYRSAIARAYASLGSVTCAAAP